MKPTEKELKILRFYAIQTHTEDKYVWLRNDDKGNYIEYAFKEGAPHDNRCLSWYDSFQPGAIIRNSKAFGDKDEEVQRALEWKKSKIDSKVGGLFELHSFTCGHEEHLESSLEENEESWTKYHPGEPFIREDHICRVGCPAPKCVSNKTCSHWTYEEPVKCACWTLSEVEIPTRISIPIEDAMVFYNYQSEE